MQPTEKPLKQITSYLMFDVILDQNPSGTVYKAKHKDTGEPCLIKVITKERIKQDSTFHERIRQEEKILQSISSPRILKYLSLVETDNYFYFISEGSDDGTLENQMGRETFSEEDVVGILAMVLQGYFEYFRRALPFNNISSRTLFKNGEEYKLSLFYLPEYYEKMETSFKNLKPPSTYSSPESLEGTPINHKRDIWALGVLIYELIFGKNPFSGDNVISLARSIEKNLTDVHKNIEKTNKISTELKILMRKMLEIEGKRLTWQELVDSSLLKNFKSAIENNLIPDYEAICNDIKTGRAKFKTGKAVPSFKNLPVLSKDPTSIKKEALEILECLDNAYGSKARMLLGLEYMYSNWHAIFLNGGDPVKFTSKASPVKALMSPKKILNSPKKLRSPTKKKQKALSEKFIEEADYLEIDEAITVNLPQTSSFMQKRSEYINLVKTTSTTVIKPEKNVLVAKEQTPKGSLKKAQSKEEYKSTGHTNSNNGKGDNIKENETKETLKIMKPGVYPQLPPKNNNEKDRMSYLKSLRPKKETLKPILEMSVEESAMLDTLTISVVKSNFQDVMQEFFYRYLHENEILEFLHNSCQELREAKVLTDRDFAVFCLAKLIVMRFQQLKTFIDTKMNVFSLEFWNQIVNLDMYKDVRKCIVENLKKYQDSHDQAYLKVKNFTKGLTADQTKFLNGDFNVPHSEFKKNFDEAVVGVTKGLYDEAKAVEKKEKRVPREIYTLVYKTMFCLEISRILSFIKLDLALEFDIVEFQERLGGFKPEKILEEVEIYKNKLLEAKK